jgi:hypothetical protein
VVSPLPLHNFYSILIRLLESSSSKAGENLMHIKIKIVDKLIITLRVNFPFLVVMIVLSFMYSRDYTG